MCMYVCTHQHVCVFKYTYMQVLYAYRGQKNFFLLLCEFQGLNSGQQVFAASTFFLWAILPALHCHSLFLCKNTHLFLFLILILNAWVLCLHVYNWTVFMPGAHGSQRRVSDPLVLELHMVVSYHMGARNKSGSSARASSAPNTLNWAIFPAPAPCHFLIVSF